MKAKEYYNKYNEGLTSLDNSIFAENFSHMIIEMSDETISIMKIRNVKTNSGVISTIKEANEKYNAICSLFVKNNGTCPIKKDGFKIFWCKKMPELNNYFN